MAASKYVNPMKDMQKSPAALKYLDSMKEMRESLAAMKYVDPKRDMRESLAAMKYVDPIKDMLESLAAMKYFDPMKEMRESLSALKYVDPMNEMRKSPAAFQFIDPMKETQALLAALKHFDPMKDMQESLTALKYVDPMKEMRKSLAAMKRQPLKDLPELFDAAKTAAGVLHEAWNRNSVPTAEGVAGEEPQPRELQEEMDRVVERIKSESDLAAAVQALISEVRALKTSRKQVYLASVLLPLLVGLILAILNPIANYYVAQALGSKEAVPHDQCLVQPSVAPRLPGPIDLRIVRDCGAPVRLRPKKKASVVAKVGGGDVVIFIKKHNRWALIAFTDLASGAPAAGWVYSKYLRSPK